MTDDDIRDRLNRLEHGQDTMRSDITDLRSDMAVLRNDVTEIKSTLAQLVPMMIRIDQRLSDMPSAAEFYELKGRVEEISRHQPTTLAYTPPPGKSAQG